MTHSDIPMESFPLLPTFPFQIQLYILVIIVLFLYMVFYWIRQAKDFPPPMMCMIVCMNMSNTGRNRQGSYGKMFFIELKHRTRGLSQKFCGSSEIWVNLEGGGEMYMFLVEVQGKWSSRGEWVDFLKRARNLCIALGDRAGGAKVTDWDI